MARLSLKRVVAEKLALTALIAGFGSLLVALSGKLGFLAAVVGLVIVALSPAISYIIIVYRISRKVRGGEDVGSSRRE